MTKPFNRAGDEEAGAEFVVAPLFAGVVDHQEGEAP
jgi:hypothetical protein